MGGSRRARLHIKLVHDDLEDVKLFRFEVPEELLICLIGCVEVFSVCLIHRGRNLTLLLIDLFEEAVPTVMQLDDSVNLLELPHVRIIDGLLLGVIALVEHVGVVDIGTPQYSHLINLLLAVKDGLGTILVSQQHFNLILLVLFELGELLLLWLHEDLLEDQLVLLLPLGGEGAVRSGRLLRVSEAHGIGHGRRLTRLLVLLQE